MSERCRRLFRREEDTAKRAVFRTLAGMLARRVYALEFGSQAAITCDGE
jgi:hypothetical protein